MLDWDTEGHVPLDVEAYKEVAQEILAQAPLPPTLVYKTRAGARAAWVHPALPPLEAEALSRWLATEYLSRGVTFDHGRWAWNLPFALPFVVRDGQPLDPEPFHVGNPLTQAQLPDLSGLALDTAQFLDHGQLRAPLPDRDEAISLVWRQGTSKLTPWGQAANRRMRDRPAQQAFDYSNPPLLTLNRNPTLFSWIGSLISMLALSPDTTPAHVWGTILPTAILSTRQDGRDLMAETWKMTCYCWAKEQAQSKALEVTRTTFVQTLKRGTDDWWPTAPEDEAEYAQALRRRLILAHLQDYYVLQANGLYSEHPIKSPTLIAGLRHSGLVGKDRLLHALEVQTPKGLVPLSPQRALDVFASPIHTVEITGGPPRGGRLLADGTLRLSRYSRRPDLEPEFDQRVDDWLCAMFGPQLPRALQLLKAHIAIERGPVAAFSINGPTGIGKGLLARGLSEVFTGLCYADHKIFEGWQYFLDRTPIVWLDEQPPQVKGFDAAFRQIVGGSWITVNQKHQAMVRLQANLRVLMTANSDAMIRALYARRGMSKDDRAAVAARVVHFDLSERSNGADFLRQKGGPAFTRGWVADTGTPSEGVVARHLLHLYHTVEPSDESVRFQVQGAATPEFEWEDSDVAEMGEILVHMLRQDPARERVSTREVIDFMDTFLNMDNLNKRPNAVQIGRRLSYWCGPPFGRGGMRRIDLERLATFAKKVGIMPKIEAKK
jgi:hypothetical protein